METVSITLGGAVFVILVILLLKLFAKPIAKILKLLLHAAFGYLLLFVINFFSQSTGYSLELDLPNCLVAGLGGMPGVILLVVFKYFIH